MTQVLSAQLAALHAAAVAELSSWQPPDAGQAQLRSDYLSHLAAHADGHVKAGPPAHLTASVLVMNAAGDEVLLTHHKKADAWFQFGGHLEPQDLSLWDAAQREGREESGLPGLRVAPAIIELNRHTLVGAFGRCREHLDVRYLAVTDREESPLVSAESFDVAWWPLDAIPSPSPDLVGLLARAKPVVAGGL